MYRVDMTEALGLTAQTCVTSFRIKFGPVVKLQYNAIGSLDDVFVNTHGGIGTIGLKRADKVGNDITFTFSQPVCPASSSRAGDATFFFFGLASSRPPKEVVARIVRMIGGTVSVPARAPNF
jgi:hypothetical protein